VKGDGIPVHLEVRGLFRQIRVPACGAWSRQVNGDPKFVTCKDCKETLDYVMAMEATP
jgi:hypothetical protein